MTKPAVGLGAITAVSSYPGGGKRHLLLPSINTFQEYMAVVISRNERKNSEVRDHCGPNTASQQNIVT